MLISVDFHERPVVRLCERLQQIAPVTPLIANRDRIDGGPLPVRSRNVSEALCASIDPVTHGSSFRDNKDVFVRLA